MEKQTTTGLHWLINLLLIAVCFYSIQDYPASLMLDLGLGTLAAITGPALVLSWRKRWRPSFDFTLILGGLVLILFSLTITIVAVHDLPLIVNVRTVYITHLGPFYHVIHYALTIYITVSALVNDRRSAGAEMGLVVILVYSTLNGGLFRIQADRFALLYGLSLITAMMHLNRPGLRTFSRGKSLLPLNLPVLMFLLGGMLATVTSLYVHNSLEQWLRLGNWVLVYFISVSILREEKQVERLLLAMLSIAAIVSVAGLGGVVGYAARAGWSSALRARLQMADMHSNGSGIFAAIYITLSVGLFPAWTSRWRRILSSATTVLLLACMLLTYSRSAAIGLFCGLTALLLLSTPKVKTKQLTQGLLLLLPLLSIALITLIRTPSNTLIPRFHIWKVVLNVIRHRPLLGVGLDNHFISAFSDVLSYQELQNIAHLTGTYSHNLLLEIGEGMGLVGVGLFLWLLVAAARYVLSAIRRADNPYRRRLLVTLCAASVALLIPHAFALSLSVVTLLPASLWILLGLTVAVSQAEFQDDDRAKKGNQPQTNQIQPPAELERAKRWREAPLAGLILVGVLLGVVRPCVAGVIQRRGTTAWQEGDQTKAASAFRLAARLQPLDAELQALLGDVTTGIEAVQAYRRATKLRPYYAPYHVRLGWLYWARNRFRQTLFEFEKAVALDEYGLDGVHQSALGLAYAAGGRRNLALELFQEAVLLDPTSINSPDWQPVETDSSTKIVVLNAAYTRYQETRQMDEELARLIVHHLKQPGADGSTLPQHPELVEEELAQTPATSELADESHIYLGDIVDGLLSKIERSAAANLDNEQAKRIFPKLVDLCLQWELYEDLDRTLQTYERLTQPGTPDEARLHWWQGVAYQDQNKLQEAQAEFQAALLALDAPLYHHLLGTTYVEQGQFPEGIAELERAAYSWDSSVRSLQWPLYWKGLARAYRQAGRLDEAILAYARAQFLEFLIYPHLQIQLAIGETYRERGDYAREMDTYVRTVEILSAAAMPSSQEQWLLKRLAVHAAVSYRHQGLTAEEAWAAHEPFVEANRRVKETYLAFFQEEIEKRLP